MREAIHKVDKKTPLPNYEDDGGNPADPSDVVATAGMNVRNIQKVKRIAKIAGKKSIKAFIEGIELLMSKDKFETSKQETEKALKTYAYGE